MQATAAAGGRTAEQAVIVTGVDIHPLDALPVNGEPRGFGNRRLQAAATEPANLPSTAAELGHRPPSDIGGAFGIQYQRKRCGIVITRGERGRSQHLRGSGKESIGHAPRVIAVDTVFARGRQRTRPANVATRE